MLRAMGRATATRLGRLLQSSAPLARKNAQGGPPFKLGPAPAAVRVGHNPSLNTGPATAGQLGPAWGTRYIFPARAKPSHRTGPVSFTLGLAGKSIWRVSRISAYRRGMSSHEKAMPIISASVRGLAAATRKEVGASARQSRDEAPLLLIASVVCEPDCVQSVR